MSIVKGWTMPSTGQHKIDRLQIISDAFEFYSAGELEIEVLQHTLIELCESDEEFYRAIETQGFIYDEETQTLKEKTD